MHIHSLEIPLSPPNVKMICMQMRISHLYIYVFVLLCIDPNTNTASSCFHMFSDARKN